VTGVDKLSAYAIYMDIPTSVVSVVSRIRSRNMPAVSIIHYAFDDMTEVHLRLQMNGLRSSIILGAKF
jgi:hypothetical protein